MIKKASLEGIYFLKENIILMIIGEQQEKLIGALMIIICVNTVLTEALMLGMKVI